MAYDELRAKFGKLFAEMIGTMILVMTIQVSVATGAANAALSIGLVLVGIVYALGSISGAHVNPAVSLTVFLRGKIAPHDMLMYWAFQLGGGVIGALLGALICGKAIAPGMGEGVNLLQAFLAELVFTSVLCLVVLGVATSSANEGNSFYGLAIGATVYAGAVAVGGISGASFNPAVTLGLGFWKPWKLAYVLWTIVAQLGGAVVGALAFYISAPEEFQHFAENLGDLQAEARGLIPS